MRTRLTQPDSMTFGGHPPPNLDTKYEVTVKDKMFYHTITVAPTSSVKYQTTDRIKQRKVRTKTKTDEMTIKSRTLPLSYPSPPLRSKPCKAPLTSTFMVSPSKMMMYSKVQERVQTISPITPEMCGIAWDQHHHLPEL